MRIAIDIRALMEGKTTGVEGYLINLLRNIFEIDKTNEYVLFANSLRAVTLPQFPYPNVSIKVTRYPNKFFSLAQKLGFPKLERLVGKIDLFFSPHWRAAALSRSTPLVITYHDLFFEIMPNFLSSRRRLWHWFMNYKAAARRANKVIAVSENTKKDLVEMYGIEEGRIEVVYPGVQPHPNPLLGKERELKAAEAGYFLYFGTFEPRKNIETVVAAYEQYVSQSNVQRPLVIAGSTGWKTRIEIPAGLENKIVIKKDVGEEEKAELYRNAFAFIFPSYYEGFGFPVLEAASYGIPVIAGFNSSLAEIGKDFVFFANSFRPNQFSRAMLELENDPSLCETLRGRGRQVVKNYNWPDAARKTLAVFQSLTLDYANRH